MHKVLTPTAVAGEIICTIDRMKIGFALNTELEMKKVLRQAVPKAHTDFFLSLYIYLFCIIFISDTAQCRVSEKEEQAGHKTGGLVGDRG